MKDIYNVPQGELIEKTALELKKIPSIKPPAWTEFVKTGAHKERAPARDDWWYVRAAAILKATHKLGPIGVSKLRTKYGGKKNRGVKPDKFYSGSGKIIRTILQQLEEAELVKKAEKGIHKGRIIAPKGISILDKVAAQISGKKPQAMPKKPAEVKEENKPAEKIEKKSKAIKEKSKEEKPIAQKTEKIEKKPEVKKQDIKTEQSQEIKKPAEEKPAEAKAENKVEEKKDEPEKEDKTEAKKEEKVPTAAELAEKAKND